MIENERCEDDEYVAGYTAQGYTNGDQTEDYNDDNTAEDYSNDDTQDYSIDNAEDYSNDNTDNHSNDNAESHSNEYTEDSYYEDVPSQVKYHKHISKSSFGLDIYFKNHLKHVFFYNFLFFYYRYISAF